jgi:hypothetical protein
VYTSLICFGYQSDEDLYGVEICGWIIDYFIKLCFGGYQFNSYSGYFLCYNGEGGWGWEREQY